MGAWGFEALDSDQALDWLAIEITDHAGERIRTLVDRFNNIVADNGDETDLAISSYGHELRAAAEVVLRLNFFSERLFGDLHGDLADALKLMVENSDWVESWSDPEAYKTSVNKQISALSEGPESTTLMQNLFAPGGES